MPFTLAHPAFLQPLFKGKFKLSATALVVGSMVPDFEFFFQMREVENIGHHLIGVLFFDFPVGLLSCYLFHNLLKQDLIINLPTWYRKRFVHIIDFNWNQYFSENKWRVILSLLIGIASHILIDGFTHYDGFFVGLMPVLNTTVHIFSFTAPLYLLLQIALSVLGLIMVQWAIAGLPVHDEINITAEKNIFYWVLFLFILAEILFARLIFWSNYNSFWGVFMAVMGAFIYSWTVTSLILLKSLFSKE